jgi:5-(hydroxymethyl)furfural/furfural oxidase
MYLTASARAGWHALGARLGLYFLWCNRPYSRGSVSLKSPDPDVYPNVDLNLLSDPRDLQRMIAAARFVAGLVVHPALNAASDDFFPASFSTRIKQLSRFNTANRILASGLGLMLDSPGLLRHAMIKRLLLNGRAFSDTLASESMLEDFVRRSAFGVWHPSGTCRMGDPSDRSAVVDPRGKVIGTENIYVADASVMPRLPTANTNIPTIMLAEKISDMLGEER